jgi:hypothetical protein
MMMKTARTMLSSLNGAAASHLPQQQQQPPSVVVAAASRRVANGNWSERRPSPGVKHAEQRRDGEDYSGVVIRFPQSPASFLLSLFVSISVVATRHLARRMSSVSLKRWANLGSDETQLSPSFDFIDTSSSADVLAMSSP